METIKYLGFYDFPVESNERICSLSGTNKMDFISDLVNQAGFHVTIVSPSWTRDDLKNKDNLKGKKIDVNAFRRLILFPSLNINNSFLKPFKVGFSLFYLTIWLIVNLKRNDKLLVYHSPLLSFPLLFSRFFKRYKIILEVEEIYSEVWSQPFLLKRLEYRLIKSANSYIFASDLLSARYAKTPSLVIYGNYNIPAQPTSRIELNDGINLVYAGSLDSVKGGVFNAIKSMSYLGDEYHLNICGYGSKEQINQVLNLVQETNSFLGRKACVFHGKLIGSDLSALLFNCDIGLNPQHQGDYMTTAFPSKILTYFRHNLRIVSSRIESILVSSIAENIHFAESDSPSEIAAAIKRIKVDTKVDNSTKISFLQEELFGKLENFLYSD